MNKKTSNEILSLLKEIIKNPKPELNFNNNYELIVSVILSAQTTDKRVNEITPNLFLKYKDYNSLALANINDVIQIIKPLGMSKIKGKNIINMAKEVIELYDGILPNDIDSLTKLSGVGRKTASVVLALGFNIPSFPVDTHLIRMANVFKYVKNEKNPIVIEASYKKYINKEDWILAHHLFLLFGRYHCKAIKPLCDGCKLNKYCTKKDYS